MFCQSCGKNPATTYLKKTINGETTEMHLCADCAAKQGIGNMWNGFGFNIGDFWGSLFAEPSARALADTVRCECCGKAFNEIAKSGQVGCPSCYITFYDRCCRPFSGFTVKHNIPVRCLPMPEHKSSASVRSMF